MKQIEAIPNSPQERFLQSNIREIGFGGAAGGAKSFSLILDALYQLNKPGYNAILFRRTYKRLKEADGLIDLSQRVYKNLGGHYRRDDYVWTFPAYHNNTIRFSHIEHENDVDQYSGSQYAYIAFDELQEFLERQYLFLFSRNRSSNPDIDLYIRSTFNPGNIGHYWIKKRFIDTNCLEPKYFTRVNGVEIESPDGIGRQFIPSRLEDNPYLYQGGKGEYEKGLSQLDEVDYRRLRLGDWEIKRTGRVYHTFEDVCEPSYELDLSKAVFYHSHDFGTVNRAWALFAKIDKTYYLIYEELMPEATTSQQAERILSHFTNRKIIAGYGGALSERQSRTDYATYGLHIRTPPISDVESQIRMTNEMFKNGTLKICSDMALTTDQLENCVRDSKGGIQDKSIWHHCDCLRYFAAGVTRRGWSR